MTLIPGEKYIISRTGCRGDHHIHFTLSELQNLINDFNDVIRLFVWKSPSITTNTYYKIGFEMDSAALSDFSWYRLLHPDIEFYPLNSNDRPPTVGGVSWLDSLLSDSEIQLLLHDSQI